MQFLVKTEVASVSPAGWTTSPVCVLLCGGGGVSHVAHNKSGIAYQDKTRRPETVVFRVVLVQVDTFTAERYSSITGES
jgi:hypothetical protein